MCIYIFKGELCAYIYLKGGPKGPLTSKGSNNLCGKNMLLSTYLIHLYLYSSLKKTRILHVELHNEHQSMTPATVI